MRTSSGPPSVKITALSAAMPSPSDHIFARQGFAGRDVEAEILGLINPRGQRAASACIASKDRFGEGFRMPARRDLSSGTEGRRPKAPQEGTRGDWSGGLPRMGFDGAAAWVGDVIGSGSMSAVASLARRRLSTGRFWPERRQSEGRCFIRVRWIVFPRNRRAAEFRIQSSNGPKYRRRA